MKRHFAIFISALISLSLAAQNNPSTRKSTLERMHVNGQVKSIKETSYKAVSKKGAIEKGKPARDRNVLPWLGYWDTFSQFDTHGNQTSVTDYTPDPYVLFFVYDENSSIERMGLLNKNGDTTQRSDFTLAYKNGYVTEMTYTGGKGQPMFALRTVNTYDSLGHLVLIEEYDSLKQTCKISRTYDADGNLSEENMEIFNLQMKYVSKYDPFGNITEETTFKNGKQTGKSIIAYDEHHNLTEYAFYDAKGKIGKRWKFTYELDAQGNWTKRTEYINGKAKYIIERELTYY